MCVCGGVLLFQYFLLILKGQSALLIGLVYFRTHPPPPNLLHATALCESDPVYPTFQSLWHWELFNGHLKLLDSVLDQFLTARL